MSEFWQGFLAGGVVAILAFVLAVAWELWRDHRRASAQARAAIALLLEAIARNREALSRNLADLETRREPMNQGRMLAGPFRRLDRDAVYSFSVSWILQRGPTDLILRVAEVIRLSDSLNTELDFRDQLVTAGAALVDLAVRLEGIDGNLEERSIYLDGALARLESHPEVTAFRQ